MANLDSQVVEIMRSHADPSILWRHLDRAVQREVRKSLDLFFDNELSRKFSRSTSRWMARVDSDVHDEEPIDARFESESEDDDTFVYVDETRPSAMRFLPGLGRRSQPVKTAKKAKGQPPARRPQPLSRGTLEHAVPSFSMPSRALGDTARILFDAEQPPTELPWQSFLAFMVRQRVSQF